MEPTYEWDEAKRKANFVKHDVDFAAIEAFEWDTALESFDDRHDEPRWIATGFIDVKLFLSSPTRYAVTPSVSLACARRDHGRKKHMPKALSRNEMANMNAYEVVAKYGKEKLANLTFDEIRAKYGEDVAICAGIVADPDTLELDAEWFAKAKPVSETHPHIVEAYRRRRGKQKAPTKVRITIRLDADLVAHLRATGRGWQTRVNEALRKAVLEGS